MSTDLEYAIKNDIRNNPVIREVDVRQRREMWRTVLLVVCTVGALLLVARQYLQMQQLGIEIEQLKADLEADVAANRQLRLNHDRLIAPAVIDRRARQLGLRPSTLDDTIVIDRGSDPPPSDGVLARVQ
jgi:hypothetical protein